MKWQEFAVPSSNKVPVWNPPTKVHIGRVGSAEEILNLRTVKVDTDAIRPFFHYHCFPLLSRLAWAAEMSSGTRTEIIESADRAYDQAARCSAGAKRMVCNDLPVATASAAFTRRWAWATSL